MRRLLAAMLAGAVLFAGAACSRNNDGDDGGDGGTPTSAPPTGGGRSTEEICTEGEQLALDYQGEWQAAGEDLRDAVAGGDPQEIEDAAAEFTDVTDRWATDMRTLVADAEDPEVREDGEAFATELEELADAMASGDPSALDTSGLDEASQAMDEHCA
jgi:hypothetical protein